MPEENEAFEASDAPTPETLDERGQAVEAALNFLSYRPRTRHEVQRKLVSRGFSEDATEAALQRLDAVGLIDDAAFVALYVRDRISHRPMGSRRMVNELYLKGIPRERAGPLIEAALQDEAVDERSLAVRVAEQKYGTLSARQEPTAVLKRRLRDHLASRGFAPGLAREVVDSLIDRREAG